MADYVPLPGSTRARQRDAQRGPGLDPGEQVEVTVTLAGPALPEVDGSFARLSRDQLASGYGADP
jgi:hypothetical protein